MAYNLTEKIQTKTKSIISSPVLPGTIQMTPSGNIIILHRDCQTTGGYSRILQLNEKSLNDLSQLKIGDKIKFKLIN
jgi:allophanate hydrolase subunit 2